MMDWKDQLFENYIPNWMENVPKHQEVFYDDMIWYDDDIIWYDMIMYWTCMVEIWFVISMYLMVDVSGQMYG